MIKQADEPSISFIMPVLNEEKTLVSCLDSIYNLEYPKEKIEILIATGPSSDNTNSIIQKYQHKQPNIIIIDNPTGNTAIGRNKCIEHSTNDLIMNYSGHVQAEKNLLKILVTKIHDSPKEVVSVGCANVSPTKQNFVGKSAAAVFSSFIGGKNLFVQNAEFTDERYVDHISFALYRKKPVVDAGMFDPEFWCGQDAELDLRLIQQGYKILFTPATKVYHYKRSTIRSLFRQMYRYGIARAKMGKKHRKTLKPFHFIGSVFIIGFLALIGITLLELIPIWILPLLTLLYILASMASTILVTKNIGSILTSPFFALIIHSGYGLGFLRGLIYSKV